MPKYEMNYDLTGKVFGHLTVLKYLGGGKWLCQCECSSKNTVEARSDRLRSKDTISCGCIKRYAKKRWEPINIDKDTYGVPLSKGQIALIDKEDFDKVKDYGWSVLFSKKRNVYYAVGIVNSKKVLMHRFIMNADGLCDIDHKDHNTLNNRKSNIRICIRTQNNMNRDKQKNNSSGYKGVSINQCGNYFANITVNKRTTYLGTFKTALEASEAYQKAAKELHGEFYYDPNKE